MTQSKGERSGGTVRVRGTHDGKRVDVYHAVCEVCDTRGPASPNSQRGAKKLAKLAGWECERKRVARALMETYVWIVRCPTHHTPPSTS